MSLPWVEEHPDVFNDAAFTITAADKLEPSSPITVSVPMSSDNNYDQLCSASKPSFHSLRIQLSILAHRLSGHLVKWVLEYLILSVVISGDQSLSLVLIVIHNVQPPSLVLSVQLPCMNKALQPQELPDTGIGVIYGVISWKISPIFIFRFQSSRFFSIFCLICFLFLWSLYVNDLCTNFSSCS